MKRFLQWLIYLVRQKPEPKPPVEPDEPITPTNPATNEDDVPLAFHDPTWSFDVAKHIMRESGFVNNPSNSRGRLKIILPSKYSGTVVRCYVFAGGVRDVLKRALPNEEVNRQRYYGSMAPDRYPKGLAVRWDCNVNGEARDYCYVLADPCKREG